MRLITSLPPKRWGFSKAPPLTTWPSVRSMRRKTTGGGAHVDGQAQHVLATQVERDAVVEDGVLGDGDDRVDLGDGLAGFLEDVHAPADDGELDVTVGRLDLGLAGQSEVPRAGTPRPRCGRESWLAALADLDDALAAAARAAARLRAPPRETSSA